MATAFYPIIKRDQFESFRRVVRGDFPDTYDEWEQFSNNEALKLHGQKFEVVRPEIDFDEYVVWLSSRRDENTLHGLKSFAAFIHARNQH